MEETLLVPRGVPNLAPINIDLREINAAEDRIIEIQGVNKHKAPELLACFNRAYLACTKQATMLEQEKNEAQREANKQRSICLLDRAPEQLKAKGLSNTKDMREAILDIDEEYQAALIKVELITTAQQLLKDKAKGIEMAYTSVKKIIGEGAYNYGGGGSGLDPQDPQMTGNPNSRWRIKAGETVVDLTDDMFGEPKEN